MESFHRVRPRESRVEMLEEGSQICLMRAANCGLPERAAMARRRVLEREIVRRS
jgi:hypothetical protein